MSKNVTSATIELPYPENEASTHWDDCWRHRGHHNCAVARVRELEAEYTDDAMLEMAVPALREATTRRIDIAEHRRERSRVAAAYIAALEARLAAQGEELERLTEALEGLSKMYTRAWDRVDGALVMMPESVPEFEEAHRNARIALGEPLLGDLPGDDDEVRAALGE